MYNIAYHVAPFMPLKDLLIPGVRDMLYVKTALRRRLNTSHVDRVDAIDLLVYACETGMIRIVKFLCEAGVNIDRTDRITSCTPFFAAMECQQKEVMLYLMSVDRFKCPANALSRAVSCLRGEILVSIVSELCILGAEVNGAVLYKYIKGGNVAAVKVLLLYYRGSIASNYFQNQPLPPIVLAISQCNVAMVDLILARGGIDVNQVFEGTHRVFTPLLQAVDQGNVAIVESLISHGADVNKSVWDYELDTPLKNAVKLGKADIAVTLLSHGADESSVDDVHRLRQLVLKCGREDHYRKSDADKGKSKDDAIDDTIDETAVVSVEEILHVKKLASLTLEGGLNTIHTAVRDGDLDMVKDLLELGGVDVNLRTESGNAPIHFAAHCGHVEVMKLLLSAGANKRIVNNLGQTPFDLVQMRAHIIDFKGMVRLMRRLT